MNKRRKFRGYLYLLPVPAAATVWGNHRRDWTHHPGAAHRWRTLLDHWKADWWLCLFGGRLGLLRRVGAWQKNPPWNRGTRTSQSRRSASGSVAYGFFGFDRPRNVVLA